MHHIDLTWETLSLPARIALRVCQKLASAALFVAKNVQRKGYGTLISIYQDSIRKITVSEARQHRTTVLNAKLVQRTAFVIAPPKREINRKGFLLRNRYADWLYSTDRKSWFNASVIQDEKPNTARSTQDTRCTIFCSPPFHSFRSLRSVCETARALVNLLEINMLWKLLRNRWQRQCSTHSDSTRASVVLCQHTACHCRWFETRIKVPQCLSLQRSFCFDWLQMGLFDSHGCHEYDYYSNECGGGRFGFLFASNSAG